MSIPPLVCSTPPPPDQCEDDKDHDDYELPYNMTPEDDESNDYDFGNYPTYNDFTTHAYNKHDDVSSNIKCKEDQEIAANKLVVNSEKENNDSDSKLRTKDTRGNKLGHDDDFDIEDLNLKIDSESSSPSVKDISIVDEISKDENHIDRSSLHVPNTSSSESQDESVSTINDEPEAFVIFESPPAKLEAVEKECTPEQSIDNSDNTASPNCLEEIMKNETVITDVGETSNVLDGAIDDEFGDFDEFQFIAPQSKPNIVLDSCENPWEDKTSDNTEFGNFTANFDNNQMDDQNPLPDETSEKKQNDQKNPVAITHNVEGDDEGDDDSFGDFDDFQLVSQSETKAPPEEEICEAVPVFNFQATDNEVQLMESINKVLSSIFQEEVSEPMGDGEPKLESLLSETWGHLTETDVRQPYIINWNSSLGQKTLLRALCIDSRNILFGPKWTHNMPKYAANLSSAPLQPQKQQTSNALQSEATSSEKPTNKLNTWSDPFSNNGQQSCNSENESSNEPRPTDLDVFEAAPSTKSDKIYSSTLSVQPIRQINLPDTHIFTPTDSETPRSKTIHYDTIPNILSPETVTEKHDNQVKNVISPSLSNIPNVVDDDDDDWEFQEFKTTPKINTVPEMKSQPEQSIEKTNEIVAISNSLPKPSMAYQTDLLQPIKIEPAMPTLNWPDPGQVKEEFDSFTDFASSSSWIHINPPNSQIDNSKATAVKIDSHEVSKKQDNVMTIQDKEITNSVNENNLDDDFDTFQSALPSVNKAVDFNSDSLSEIGKTSLVHNINHLDYDNPILQESSVKTDTISFESTVKSNEGLQHSLGFMMNTTESKINNVTPVGTQPHMNLLQPVPAHSAGTSTSTQQKSGQILQPLSLESYSQINWPSPGIDLQDLSRFNPVETLHSLKSDLSVSGQSRGSPIHNSKPIVNTQLQEDDVWGEFVSSKPTPQLPTTKKQTTFGDDDEWTDFVSSPSVKPHNGLNTISLNVHTNSNMQKTANQGKFPIKSNQISLDIPSLNYITPKNSNHKSYNDRHFQNL